MMPNSIWRAWIRSRSASHPSSNCPRKRSDHCGHTWCGLCVAPGLRILLIGGEACPPALVKRWSRLGRTLLNSYGPTETTVAATLGVMTPDRPVTIGRPLPTYSIVILDRRPRRRAGDGRSRRDRHRRHRRRGRLSQPVGAYASEVHRRFPRAAEQYIRPHLPHRRPRTNRRGRRDRIFRPHRHSDQAARLPHRTDGDRVGPARDSGNRPGRRDDVRA